VRNVTVGAVVSSWCAPVVLVGGWTAGGAVEGAGYDPVRQTISVLGSNGASAYWVITSALVALGLCHVVTAKGLRAAALRGRVALGAGGVSAIMLTLVPAPSNGGSLPHGVVVAVGFTLLAVWPVLGAARGAAAPWGLRLGPCVAATALMWVGGTWFWITLHDHGAAGVAERVLTFAQSFWPLVVVTSCVRHPARERQASRADR
jgi:hypothetical membrane protein